jgi:hypothetical protein
MANTTWSTTDRVNTTLSGGNLKATQNATNSGVRSVSFKTTGKHYWEVTVTANQSETGFGISNAGPVKIGSCYVNFIGRIILQGVGTGDSIGSLSNGSVVCFALDMTNKLLWIRQGASGRWNGRVNADPATGVGGRDISSITSTGIFALFCNPATTLGELGTDDADTTIVGDTTATANFGDSGFVGVAPAGFAVGLTSVTTTLSTTLSASRPGVGSVVVTTTGVAITAPIVGVGTVAMPLLTTPVITTTWNSADKSANITLSNGDLTAAPSTSAEGAVRSNTAKSPGSKTYFEVSTAGAGGTHNQVGIATASAALGSVGIAGAGGALIAVQSGTIWYNGSSTGITLGVANGSVLCFAVDLVNSRLWVRLGNGLWNNSGAADPTTNVGGVNISTLFSAANAYAVASFNTLVSPVNANFGVRPFAFAVPAGFDRWDTQTVFPPYVSWNPADKSPGIALTNNDLTAKNIDNSVCSTRPVNGQLNGKFYWECTCDTYTYFQNAIGIATRRAIIPQTASVLTPGCCVEQGGTIYLNGVTTGVSLGAITTGNVVCVAVDITNRLIWFRKGAAGNWNGSASANPATGVGGISIISLASSVVYPWITIGNTNDQVTANFGDTAFGGAVPSGFTSGFPTPGPPLAAAITQVGVEEWGPGIPQAQITQTALEQWGVIPAGPTSRAVVTQLGLEEWVVVAGVVTQRQYAVTVIT